MIIIYFGIYDDYTIRSYKPKGTKPILIRVLDPSYRTKECPYNIQYINKYLAVLKLFFEDISERPPKKYENRFITFNSEMAKEFYDFIMENEFDEIIIHCCDGASRSSALMICFSKIINRPDLEEFIRKSDRYYPNTLVIEEFTQLNFKPTEFKGLFEFT